MVTKWRMTTKAAIRDGDLGRAEETFMGQVKEGIVAVEQDIQL